uniref:NADH-ubiquinone oxidoreductase chain 2 n=1 Tax=Prionospio sp. 3 MH-2023 TaxID=3059271 RepID=A0AAU6QG10_9ANNE
MMLYPFLHLFLSTLMMSTAMALCSHHWTVIWMMLELNMISFIPIITSSNWHQEHEAGLKYLMFQALGSSLLLLFSFNPNMAASLVLALTIKLGAAPFHFWFPSVMKGISWSAAILLMTWQKVAPMALMFSCFHHKPLMTALGTASAAVGGIGGMNQTHMRPLLAYSSIGHMGWIIVGTAYSPSSAAMYFMVYLILSLAIISTCLLSNVSLLKNTLSPHNSLHLKLLIPTMISLGGLPPFAGFIPKLVILASMKTLIVPMILIVSSLMNLTYYLNFIFTAYLSQDQLKTPSKKEETPFFLSLCTWASISPLPMLLITFILI